MGQSSSKRKLADLGCVIKRQTVTAAASASVVEVAFFNRRMRTQAMYEMTDEVSYVVAIDIGTSYSGYAYQDNQENKKKLLSIETNSFQGGSTLSMKTTTAILLDKEKNFHSFGNDAAKSYATALENGTQHDFIFVKGFKMNLYHEKKVSHNLLLKDTEGRDIDGLMIFTESIKCLKKDAITDMTKRLGEIDEDKITFVLTVPAIWREPAKQFMRLAAEKAGIKPGNLVLALEPEAAALYCKHLELNSAFGSGDDTVKRCFLPGGKYMIMDLGGGTVDTVVHETNEDGDVVELYKSSGGPWGGEYVNVNFMSYLGTTYGEDAAKRFKETRCFDHYELEQEFEIKKRQLNVNSKNHVRLRVPGHLKTLANRPIDKHTVDHLYINKTEFKSFFDPLIEEIVQHLKSIFSEIGEIPLLILVGGFSESAYAQEKIKEEFTNIKVLVPRESGLAVLKGAVLFGFNPVAVKRRKCRFTYGICINVPFDETIHSPEKLLIEDGDKFCSDVFKILVREGENIEFEEVREGDGYCSRHTTDEQKCSNVHFCVHSSTRKDPTYVTDTSCSELGEIIVNPPEGGWPENKNYYTLKFKFGRTEIFVNVNDTTNNRQYDATFDMLG